MIAPQAAALATAAAVNRPLKHSQAGIAVNKKPQARRQRLLGFNIREAVIARAFLMRRRNAPAPILAPPRTIGGQR
jgi:hypothetical protein